MLFQCWETVCDGGLALNQHCVNAPCFWVVNSALIRRDPLITTHSWYARFYSFLLALQTIQFSNDIVIYALFRKIALFKYLV